MTAPQSNSERIFRLYEAFENEGPEAVGKLIEETFDDDVEFIPLQTGEVGGRVYRGRDGMLAFFGDIHETLENVCYEAPQRHGSVTTSSSPSRGLPELTGRPRCQVRQDLSLVYEFEGGFVGRMTAYDSPAEALEAAQKGHADA